MLTYAGGRARRPLVASYQAAWRLCDDERGWMAHVTWTEQHDWGPGKYVTMVSPDRVRVWAST